MADSLVSIALENLTNVIGQQVKLFTGVSHELERLKDTFQSIQALLHDAESRQAVEESVHVWLSKLKNVSYDIDDVLDKGKILGLRGQGGDEDSIRNKVRQFLLSPYNCLDHVVSRYKVAHRIKETRERLDQIADDKNRYNFSSCSLGGDHRMFVRSQRITTSLVEESEMILGRENDKEIMVSRLVSVRSHEDVGRVHVVAIVGIGGLGKTTLAQQIFYDARVRDHFSNFLWVCVSDVFDVMRLTKAIIEGVKWTSTSFSEFNSMQNELAESLRGKRFLLVLDDVWNDEEEKWKMLRVPLMSGAQGSRILVTTRSEKVANTMNAIFIHNLQGLSDDHSWELFRIRAFDESNAEEYSKLEGVGRKIVKNCKGVPLSIKVMGSVMHSKKTVEDWENILNSKTWFSLPQVTNKILPALLLTYCNLPTNLKQCFAYCSMFPKDWPMRKDTLVKLWIAQGFIQSEGSREIDDIAVEYFDELVAWSLLQGMVMSGTTIYTMHDLLHDLAEFIAKDETYDFVSSSSNVRHAFLSFTFTVYGSNNVPIALPATKKLRTLFLTRVDGTHIVTVSNLFKRARFLRSVIFEDSSIEMLPNAIGKMKHLRYLDLSGLKMVELPESVSGLCHLHTLNLSQCHKLKKLPRGIGRMVSLRHLEIERTYDLEYLPKGLGRIRCLQSLCKFIVGGGGHGGQGCRIAELRRLNSLRGSLQIQNLERVASKEEAEKAQLWNKPHLRKLLLQMEDRTITDRVVNLLEGLRPHVNLEELELECYSILSKLKLPSWMEDSSFSKLTELKIRGFHRCSEPKSLPGLGKLPALKSLHVTSVGISKLGHEFYYGNNSSSYGVNDSSTTALFPRLEELSLHNMYEWKEWELMTTLKKGADAPNPNPKVPLMPCLRKLELSGCSRVEGLPHHLDNAPLTYLSIIRCERIKGRGCSSSFPLLETFKLDDSSGFLASGGLPDLPKLRTFDIDYLKNERLPDGGWERLVALQQLKMCHCYELKCLPDGMGQLQSLQQLQLCHCPELKCLPDGLGQLQSLEQLQLSSCFKLEALPRGMGPQLNKLKSLRMNDLQGLRFVPDSLGQLESLELLEMDSCTNLEVLPHSLGQLKKLKSLKVYGLEQLACLPDSVGQLESLEFLTIGACHKLESLPDSLGQLKKLLLPHGLQHLSLLQELHISRCRLLSRRCRVGGEDWPKISHIPKITIKD